MWRVCISSRFFWLLLISTTTTTSSNGEILDEIQEDPPNRLADNIPGDVFQDYPTYTRIPRTGFSCEDKINGRYYADEETDCQVFHVCIAEHHKTSFLCPVGSVFNQKYLVCDWWYNFDCGEASHFYELTADIEEEEEFPEGKLTPGDGLNLDPIAPDENEKPAIITAHKFILEK